jgi:CHAT domain-containing protein
MTFNDQKNAQPADEGSSPPPSQLAHTLPIAQEWFPSMDKEPAAAALARAQMWLHTVTNTDLRYWKNSLPRIPQPLSDMSTVSATQTNQKKGRCQGMQECLMGVRGRGNRYTDDDAQLAVRIGVENAEPSVCPYADPYYWAGFQVVGW